MNRQGVLWLGVLVLCCAIPALAATMTKAVPSIQSNGYSYSQGPLPAFVVRHADPVSPAKAQVRGRGLQVALLDRQISLLDAEPQEYTRVALRALDSQGLQHVAQIYINFNPDYQRLTLHAIRVVREGQVQDRTHTLMLELLRREQALEQSQYGGVVTAIGVLPDVRVNDLVEYEYTLSGANPIFAGRYASRIAIEGGEPIDERSLRLLYREGRAITLRAPAGVQVNREVSAGVVAESVNLRGIKALSNDTDRPDWYDPFQWLEISEFGNWDQVRQWAESLFAPPADLAPELTRKLQDWQSAKLPPARLAAEILRWVQGEIRYFGIELGINSHQPVHPNQTYLRRFGDCKDKSLLLVSLLRGVGIEAYPALVSLRLNRAVEQALPGHAAFDHAIVMARVDGRTYWLDATMPPQPGDLDAIGVFDYGRALVLGAERGGLVEAGYPAGYRESIESLDRYQVQAFNQPVILQTETTLSGIRAERVRWQLSNQGSDEFARNRQAYFQRLFPNAEVLAALEVRDDSEHNRLTLVSRYRLPELFEYETGKLKTEVIGTALLDVLKLPEVPQRKMPFALPHPLEVHERILFELPENSIRKVPAPSVDRTPYWNLRSQMRSDNRQLILELQLESLADHVKPAAIPAYIEDTKRLRRLTGLSFNLPVTVMGEKERDNLLKELRPFDRFERSKSDALTVEMRAHYTIRQSSLDLVSGKLTPRQEAQAHHQRGLAWDNTDQAENALMDLRKAVALAPDELRYQLDLATTLGGRGYFDEALAVFGALDKAGRLQEASAGDLAAYGRAFYYLQRYEEASAQFLEASRRGERVSSLMAALWQHLAAQRSQGKVASNLARHLDTEANHAWPYAVGEMLLGRRSEKSLLESAWSEDAGIKRDQTCEAQFYLGSRALLDGDNDKARDHFDAAYKLEVRPYTEFLMARYELERLGGPKSGLMDIFKVFK